MPVVKRHGPIVIDGPLAAAYTGTVLFMAEALARSQVASSFPAALFQAASAALLAGAIMQRVRRRLP